ncbi:hypothetical protein NL108_001110, partial [Boleophthalmus pectinirostris]
KAVEEEESRAKKPLVDICPPSGKLSDTEHVKKGKSSPPSLVFNRLFSDIKEEPGHPALVHPSYYLYTYDKMVAPNVSLRREAEMSPEMLGALLKHHYNRRVLGHDEPPMDLHASPPVSTASPDECKSQILSADRERQAQAVSMETSSSCKKRSASPPPPPPPPLPPPSSSTPSLMEQTEPKDLTSCGAVGGPEDDKDRIVVEIMQMYSRQQEKLNATLHKQLQLEMELEALRGGEAARLRELSAEQRELRSELQAVHSEQARQLSQARHEQHELESRLEQLRQQGCACEPGAQRQQEAHYTAQ